MEKLESLENFNKSELSETHQSNIFGGAVTAGGEHCTVASDTGCMGYTSDDTNGGSTTYSGTFEVEKDCELNPGGGNTPGPIGGQLGG